MNILITGGSGFIGSALIRYIINQTQDSVINIDKLTYAANTISVEEVEIILAMLLSKLIFVILRR